MKRGARWYKYYTPTTFTNAVNAIISTGGYNQRAAETIALRVMRWHEDRWFYFTDPIDKTTKGMFIDGTMDLPQENAA